MAEFERMLAIIGNVDAWLDEEVNALVGCTGQNPRKGHYGNVGDLLGELGDAAVTAMFAIQHFTKDERKTAAVVMAALEKAGKRAEAAGYLAVPWCRDPGPCVHGPAPHEWRLSCQPDRDSG